MLKLHGLSFPPPPFLSLFNNGIKILNFLIAENTEIEYRREKLKRGGISPSIF
jgi:hypothetical protein